MDWSEWYKQYDSFPSLQARLRIVQEQITAALNECPPGPVRIVSICAGDGRDLIGTLQNHPRRNDVTASLLDSDLDSVYRGKTAAVAAGLGGQLNFIHADAALAGNYAGAIPADLVILSGLLVHLRHENVPAFIRSLRMFCRTGGYVIWNRHFVLYQGHEQVRVIRKLFQQATFEEIHFETTALDGFAVSRVRFTGQVEPLDTTRVLFEFVGLDRLLSEAPPDANVPADLKLFVSLSRRLRSRERGDRNEVASFLPSIPPLRGRAEGQAGGAETSEITADSGSANAEQTVPGRFEQIAAEHSSHQAIGTGEWQPTYAELNASANRLAQMLIACGGAPGDRVVLLLRHDAPLIASILAVLKAGRVVVVLNPGDPPARLQQILADAEPALILTDETNRNLATEIAARTLKVVCFEEHSSGPVHSPQIKVAPQNLAFLIYTSGSTGRPKAVMQSHRNVVFNSRRHSQGMEIRTEDRIALLASPSGGQGVATVWCALLSGATLCPFPPLERGVTGLADWIERHQITVYVSAPSLFRQFVKTLADGQHFPKVRLVRLGSESATSDDFAAYRKYFGNKCVLFLTLSSSETGNITQLRLTRHDAIKEGRLPVGFPAEGIEVMLLDERGCEVSDGETGEIAVRSRYLSPGYWRDEMLTAERFSKGDSLEDCRVFYSGDRARREANGLLWFAGRKDSRVKVHGYRVELSEIEEALALQPGVERSLVIAKPLSDGNTQLVAYVVPCAGVAAKADELRRSLRTTLPGYMVPAAFVFLNDFPLTPHGKIDRQALPAPSEPKSAVQRKGKPRDIFESTLVKIWESVLGFSPIGRRDDFFELGGTSLQSVEVLLHIEERLGALLPPSVLAEHSTIERLAAALAGYVVSSPSPLVPLRADGTGRPLFLVHSGQGDVVTFGQLAHRLAGRPIYGLQSVGLQGEAWPLMSVPAMAHRYLPEILAKDPTGPYLLGGTCMGGMVAFELAQMLVRRGKEVGLLALLDVPHPLPAWKHYDWVERFYGTLRDPLRDAFRILRWFVARAAGFGRNARWLPAYRRFVAHMNSRANRSYKPGFYPGTLTLFITANTKFPREDLRLLMRRHAQATQVITIPGLRSGLFLKPAVDELATQLQKCMDAATRRPAD